MEGLGEKVGKLRVVRGVSSGDIAYLNFVPNEMTV